MKLLNLVLCIPKTVIFNFSAFPFKIAIKLPVVISHKVKVNKIGKVMIEAANIKPAMIRVGFGGSFALGENNVGYWHNCGEVIFGGKSSIGRGSSVITGNNGVISFGMNFEGNANCIYNASLKIAIGDNCLIGWGTTIIDGDGHTIITPQGEKAKNGKITIGNHTWICSDVKLLKNAGCKDHCIIASNALVSKRFDESNIMIGGTNCIIGRDIDWRK